MKSYKDFNNIIRGKNILYIPIISCINRDTQEYNLAADGNVNRFITNFIKCDSFNKLFVILPKKHIKNSEKYVDFFKEKNPNITILYDDNFGIHAGEQRNNKDVVKSLLNNISILVDNLDLIIFESQLLGTLIKEHFPDKDLIFWNPVSETNEKTRNFLTGYKEINDKCLEISKYMIVASIEQYEYFNNKDKVILIDQHVDRKIFPFNVYCIDKEVISILNSYKEKTIYYLPYRLTDEGYKIDLVLEFIKKCKNDFVILYSDPNNSHLLETLSIEDSLKEKFIKVSTERDTYYTILDYGVEIPYFEDIEFINHAAIEEFKDSNSKVYLYKQYKNPYNVNSYKNFIILDNV